MALVWKMCWRCFISVFWSVYWADGVSHNNLFSDKETIYKSREILSMTHLSSSYWRWDGLSSWCDLRWWWSGVGAELSPYAFPGAAPAAAALFPLKGTVWGSPRISWKVTYISGSANCWAIFWWVFLCGKCAGADPASAYSAWATGRAGAAGLCMLEYPLIGVNGVGNISVRIGWTPQSDGQ